MNIDKLYKHFSTFIIMDFINNILAGKIEGREHFQFVRFGRGRYAGRAALSFWKTGKIKLGGGFEYANDFVFLCAKLGMKFSGLIMSREDLGLGAKKKSGVYIAAVTDIESSKIEEIKDKTYCMLLDAQGEGLVLKMKKKLPKPGKAGDTKVDDKFCILETDLKYWEKIKEYFKLPEGKKIQVKHSFFIEDITIPKGETNPELMRLNAKRKGKIERIVTVDGVEKREMFPFEA